MKKEQKNQTTDTTNSYDIIFDDAQRKLSELGDFDYLKNIPRANGKESVGIPFPYGGKKTSAYNCN